MPLPRLVAFDMTGTTVEDGGQVQAAFAAALAECGIVPDDEQIRSVRGASKREAIHALVSRHGGVAWQDRADEAYTRFCAFLQRAYRSGVAAVPGTPEAIAWLRSRAVRIAFTTGLDRDVASMLIDALGWRTLADAFVCGDEVARGRPAPYLIFEAMQRSGVDSVHDVAVIGDTTADLQAGRNAGVRWNIASLSGAHPRVLLEREPHTHLVASVAELPALFQGN